MHTDLGGSRRIGWDQGSSIPKTKKLILGWNSYCRIFISKSYPPESSKSVCIRVTPKSDTKF